MTQYRIESTTKGRIPVIERRVPKRQTNHGSSQTSGTLRTTVALIAAVVSLSAFGIGSATLTGQPLERQINPFQVRDAFGEPLINAFTGGQALTRIGILDLENDGYPDLFALNLSEELRLYRNTGTFPFRLDTSSYWSSIPIRSWFRFADLDGDGDQDLFTSGERSELMILRNIGTTAEPDFLPADSIYQANGDVIRTEQQTVPTFVDIDSDGDLDLFSGNIDGTITYYENTGSATEPAFVFQTSRFEGLIVISPAGTERKSGAAIQSGAAHGASVLDFSDLDDDGDLDMLFGDFFTATLLHFENRGTKFQPDFDTIWVDTAFAPLGDVVRTTGFNQAVTTDLDNDGDLDVVVSSLLKSAFSRPIDLYLNDGTPAVPLLRRASVDLTSEIDVGLSAAPTLISDSEREGLLVGAEDGSISWFRLGEEDGTEFLQLERRYVLNGITLTVPAAGDLDGDGISEIVVGKSDWVDDGTTLRLYRFDGNELVRMPWHLDTTSTVVRSNASPALVDIDGDSDLDLFVGARNGRFVLFENVGSPTEARFEFATPPSPFDTLDLGSNSVIRFGDIDGDGDPDAMTSGQFVSSVQRDTVRFWINNGGRFTEVQEWPALELPVSSVPCFGDIAGHPYLFVGTQSGGIIAFRDTASGTSGALSYEDDLEDPVVRFTPTVLNPGSDAVSIEWRGLGTSNATMSISDATGRLRSRLVLTGSEGTMHPNLQGLPSGRYFWSIDGGAAGSFVVVR